MEVWIDVYDANGIRQGSGPVRNIRTVDVSRSLDRMGRFTVLLPGTDFQALDLLARGRRVFIYADDGVTVREIGNGIIRRRRFSDASDDPVFEVSGPDLLQELAEVNVLLNRQFDDVAANAALNTLISLATGWSVSTTETLAVNRRFDGISVYAALEQIARGYGRHFRLGTERVLEFGQFGEEADIWIVSPDAAATEVAQYTNVGVVEQIELAFESQTVVNWLLPVGSGQGNSLLTLGDSTRTAPYTIESTTGPDGETIHYIKDAASIATYGTIQRTFSKSSIVPLAHTDIAKERAANALYDAAAAYLERNSQEQIIYRVAVRGLMETVRPGDKVHLQYTGRAWDYDRELTWVDIDETLWVLEVAELIDERGLVVQLDLSDVDMLLETDEDVLLDAVESVRQSSFQMVPTGYVAIFKDRDVVQASEKDAVFCFTISNQVLDLSQVVISFKTHPLYSWTEWIAPDNFNHNVKKDDQYPTNVQLLVNDQDVSSDYGGPWLSDGTNKQLSKSGLDITDLIKGASGGFQQEHTVTIRAGARSGQLEVDQHPDYVSTPEASHGIVEMQIDVRGVTSTSESVTPIDTSSYYDGWPGGVASGADKLLLMGNNGVIYRTSDGSTPSGDGGPTYTAVDISGSLSGTLITYRVKGDSPLYAGTGSRVDLWVLTDVGLYLVTGAQSDSPDVELQYSFPETITQANFDASFTWSPGQFVAIVYRANSDGRIRVVTSSTGGGSWGTPGIVGADESMADGEIGISLDPHNAGHVYTFGQRHRNLYRSPDYGANWFRIEGGQDFLSSSNLNSGNTPGCPLYQPFGVEPTRYLLWNGPMRADLIDHTKTSIQNGSFGTDKSLINYVMASPAERPGRLMYVGKSSSSWGVFMTDNALDDTVVWQTIVPGGGSVAYRQCFLTNPDGVEAYLIGEAGAFAVWDEATNTVDDRSVSTAADIIALFGW